MRRILAVAHAHAMLASVSGRGRARGESTVATDGRSDEGVGAPSARDRMDDGGADASSESYSPAADVAPAPSERSGARDDGAASAQPERNADPIPPHPRHARHAGGLALVTPGSLEGPVSEDQGKESGEPSASGNPQGAQAGVQDRESGGGQLVVYGPGRGSLVNQKSGSGDGREQPNALQMVATTHPSQSDLAPGKCKLARQGGFFSLTGNKIKRPDRSGNSGEMGGTSTPSVASGRSGVSDDSSGSSNSEQQEVEKKKATRKKKKKAKVQEQGDVEHVTAALTNVDVEGEKTYRFAGYEISEQGMDVVRRFKIYQEEECGESFEGLDPFGFLETMARSNMNMYRISSIDELFLMWEMFMYSAQDENFGKRILLQDSPHS